MDSQTTAAQIVDAWIKDNQMYLKDGGGAKGLFPAVRSDLVARIEAALSQQAGMPDQKRAPARKKRADATT